MKFEFALGLYVVDELLSYLGFFRCIVPFWGIHFSDFSYRSNPASALM